MTAKHSLRSSPGLTCDAGCSRLAEKCQVGTEPVVEPASDTGTGGSCPEDEEAVVDSARSEKHVYARRTKDLKYMTAKQGQVRSGPGGGTGCTDE